MSQSGLGSREFRFVAVDWNATQCGECAVSPSTEGLELSPLASPPPVATLTRDSEPPSPDRCRTKTSERPFVSCRTKLLATLENAKYCTRRPSWLKAPSL